MTAKEMFESLGYKKVDKYRNIIHYEQEIDGEIYELLGIEFTLKDKTVSCFRYVRNKFNYGAFNDLDMETLEAVYQQCKELNWL